MANKQINLVISADGSKAAREVEKVTKAVQNTSKKVKAASNGFAGMANAVGGKLTGALTSVTSAAGGMGKGISTALKMGLGPVGLLMAAIEGVIGVFQNLTKKSQAFGDGFTKIMAQVGSSLSYIFDFSNWGAGFMDGLKEVWEQAGQLADASDAVGTAMIEWSAKQERLNNTLTKSEEVLTRVNVSQKERDKAVKEAKAASEDYAKTVEKITAAKQKEAEAIINEVAANNRLKLTAEDVNYIMSAGIENVDEMAQKSATLARFADAMSDETHSRLAQSRKDINELSRQSAEFQKRVNELIKKPIAGATVKVEPELPAGSIAALKKQIQNLTKQQELTIPMSAEFLNIEGQIDELKRKLTGDDGLIASIPLKLDVKDVNKDLKLVNKQVNNIAGAKEGIGELGQVFNAVAQNISAMGSESRAATVAVQALAIAEQIAAMAGAIASAAKGDPYTVAARILAAAAAVTSSIVTIQSLSKQNFAQGGIVQGQFTSGDRITAGLNAGEMVLTKQQQANLFRQINTPLTGAEGGVKEIKLKAEGRDLIAVINATNLYNSRSL